MGVRQGGERVLSGEVSKYVKGKPRWGWRGKEGTRGSDVGLKGGWGGRRGKE